MNSRAWILEQFTLFRLGLFFCCFAYWAMGCCWLKPRAREFHAAIMAVWVQFSLGTLLDTQVVRMGFWVYRPMPFALGGVPLDLHLDWGLIWGFFFLWLYSRLRLDRVGWRFVLVYLTVWTLVTLAFDAMMTEHLLFLSRATPSWWLADLALLLSVQGVTLWVYHSMLFPPERPMWIVWGCRVRSMLYVGSLSYVFYSYLPGVVLSLTDGWGARPLLRLGDGRVLAAALAPAIMLGAWATRAFTDAGLGTPLPLDPPRRLVTTGPYAFVRNPMQIAGLMLAALLALDHPTVFMLLYVVDMMLMSAVLFHLFEREELARAFGAAYLHYQRHVRNWAPRFHPYIAPNDARASAET